MKEEWEVVEGFPGYLVSNTGRVHNWDSGLDLAQTAKSNGHLSVNLWIGPQKTVTKMVSRLVAAAFMGDAGVKVVRHINGDVTDNRAENLKYCTRSEIQQQIDNSGTNYKGRKTTKRVRVVETGQVFVGVGECARAFGVTSSAISYLLRHQRRNAAGLRFEYADED